MPIAANNAFSAANSKIPTGATPMMKQTSAMNEIAKQRRKWRASPGPSSCSPIDHAIQVARNDVASLSAFEVGLSAS